MHDFRTPPTHFRHRLQLRSWFLRVFASLLLLSPSSQAATAAPTPNDAPRAVAPDSTTAAITHLQIGRTLVLDTTTRVQRIYVADPTVVESNTISPHQILLTAKAPGFTTVLLWDEANHLQSYQVSCDLDITSLQTALDAALPGDQITAETRAGRVLLRGVVSTQAAADAAQKIAAGFSKDVVDALLVNAARAKQVQLKVRFVEVDRSRLNQLGINIFAPGGTSSIGSGSTQQFTSTAAITTGGGTGLLAGGNILTVTNPLNFLFYSTRANVGISVQDLETRQILQILSEPTITTLSGQSASFLAGGEFPFPVVQGASTGTTSITIQFRPYGVRLNFLPKVNQDGTVDLKVAPEVSALDYTNAVSISGYTIPAISTKHVETEVVLRDGQSFAISGLLDRRTTDALSHTPGIASIPILGALFKSKNVNLSTTELIVVVTPTVVDPLAETDVPADPKMVRPFLDNKSFDTAIPAAKR